MFQPQAQQQIRPQAQKQAQQQIRPQAQPQVGNTKAREEFLQKYGIQQNDDHISETKTLFLIAVSIVFAIISLISLFFGLKIKNQKEFMTTTTQDDQTTQQDQTKQTQQTTTGFDVADPTILDVKKEVEQLDTLKLGEFENSYTDEALDLP